MPLPQRQERRRPAHIDGLGWLADKRGERINRIIVPRWKSVPAFPIASGTALKESL